MATILGIGGVCVDRIARIAAIPAWDSVGSISAYTQQQGGMVATALAAAAKLGEPAEFIGGVGDDDDGQYVMARFRETAVETRRMVVFSGGTTAFSFVLVQAESGLRTILNYRGVQERPDLKIPMIDLEGVRFLHLDGYWFATALKTAQAAKAAGITVTLDPSSRLLNNPQTPDLLCCVDYVMPGWTVAQRLSGKADPFQAAQALRHYGAQAVIITQGQAGCVVADKAGEVDRIPAFDVPVVDTTGAGDTFHGAFIAGLSKGYALRSAAQFASAAAALKCTKPGGQAGLPTFDEVQRFLHERGVKLVTL